MTIRADLVADAVRAECEAEFTLRQVAEMTGTPLPTIRRWVHVDRVLPYVHRGRRRVRVKREVVLRFFGLR
jgi:excisionase family DNA binding protein